MRELLAIEETDARAAEAIALFCYQAKKAIGALAAAMGGVSTLVFSGGIGEHATPIRARITRGLEHLGIELDDARNAASLSVISTQASPCKVRVIATDEESVIARETAELIGRR
jgi:acetate kinase